MASSWNIWEPASMAASGWARTARFPTSKGYRKDVVDALKHINVPVVRWPGGCFADLYDWRDGIGPREKRLPASMSIGAG